VQSKKAKNGNEEIENYLVRFAFFETFPPIAPSIILVVPVCDPNIMAAAIGKDIYMKSTQCKSHGHGTGLNYYGDHKTN
jgi:hypothetical protein